MSRNKPNEPHYFSRENFIDDIQQKKWMRGLIMEEMPKYLVNNRITYIKNCKVVETPHDATWLTRKEKRNRGLPLPQGTKVA